MLRLSDHEKTVRDGLPAIYPRLWRYCVSLAGNRDTGGDLAQAAMVKAIEKADQFQAGTHLDRWVFRIAQRTWLNDLRANAVRRGGGLVPVEDFDLIDEKPSTETNILAAEVLRFVMALPEAQRVTVVLVYVEGYSYKEAAEMLEIPIGTIMSRLAAARKTIAARTSDIEGEKT
ncbi:RNA polymerase sigma factor [Amylibacter sp. IMCC11727]|uniref:RNA polymerase sigma factor n=1 Tax=Amylibacter sp. IMCC11727 TaxID=3039851 RepID=UPI00244DC278|nr:RNA polymerase sigma factor [Amylibacter sp. IMCC11727]WGI23145.1 RNA polymerase sigma factor [Amylibacter sp. IMCC11727]